MGRYRPASDGFRWFNRSGVFTVDIVEGVVNKGIYLNGDRGATFLHFGNYKNSCISDPTLCGPQGKAPLITPSLSLALSFPLLSLCLSVSLRLPTAVRLSLLLSFSTHIHVVFLFSHWPNVSLSSLSVFRLSCSFSSLLCSLSLSVSLFSLFISPLLLSSRPLPSLSLISVFLFFFFTSISLPLLLISLSHISSLSLSFLVLVAFLSFSLSLDPFSLFFLPLISVFLFTSLSLSLSFISFSLFLVSHISTSRSLSYLVLSLSLFSFSLACPFLSLLCLLRSCCFIPPPMIPLGGFFPLAMLYSLFSHFSPSLSLFPLNSDVSSILPSSLSLSSSFSPFDLPSVLLDTLKTYFLFTHTSLGCYLRKIRHGA